MSMSHNNPSKLEEKSQQADESQSASTTKRQYFESYILGDKPDSFLSRWSRLRICNVRHKERAIAVSDALNLCKTPLERYLIIQNQVEVMMGVQISSINPNLSKYIDAKWIINKEHKPKTTNSKYLRGCIELRQLFELQMQTLTPTRAAK